MIPRAATRAAPLVAFAVVGALAVSACGIDAEPSARPLEPTPVATAPSTASPTEAREESTVVWLVRREALSRVLRRVTDNISLSELVAVLEAGPTPSEASRGIRSALAPGDIVAVGVNVPTDTAPVKTPATTERPSSPPPTADVAGIQLSEELRARPSDQQILAIGQTVLTLTSAGYSAIRFVGADGEPVGVPGPDGRILEGPVTESDYETLRLRS